jgi:hypothetical protein
MNLETKEALMFWLFMIGVVLAGIGIPTAGGIMDIQRNEQDKIVFIITASMGALGLLLIISAFVVRATL